MPLPGEIISLNLSSPGELRLVREAAENGRPFGIFYNHFMNIFQIGAEVEAIGATEGEGDEKDIWVKGKRVFILKKLFKEDETNNYLHAEVEYMDYLEGFYMDSEAEKDVAEYMSHCPSGVCPASVRGKRHDAFDVLRIMQLSDSEKFYALNMPTRRDLYIYIVNSLRLRSAYYSQRGSIDEPWYLN